MLEKVLERMATSEDTVLVIKREPEGQNACDFKALGRCQGARPERGA
jgi:hypothetical protein